MKFDTILVLDFGGQYSHLIARRVRDNSVYSEIVRHDITPTRISDWENKVSVKGLILSGGPQSVFGSNAPKFDRRILKLNLPILGLCYGHQLIANITGGKVKQAEKCEFGLAITTIDKPVGVLEGLRNEERVWMSHSDTVNNLNEEYEILAHTKNCPVAAFRHKKLPIYGLQWHPEVVHTEKGNKMLNNFLFKVCGCLQNWKITKFTETSITKIKKIVGKNKAIVALSGGIDSSISTILASAAIGKQLTAVYVDHGFMRKDESQFIKEAFNKFNLNLEIIDTRKRFLKRLKGVIEPERKRKIIGEEFIRVFEEKAEKIGAEYLLQGTIYSDRIESGFRTFSDKIKTHHNVAGLPIKIMFKRILEPLKDLYKDEVRKVAKELGLPEYLIKRQPFPGPGLAVRIIGEVTEKKLDIIRTADEIVRKEIENAGLNYRLWQYFAVLTNSKSVGVKGDSRAYGNVIAIRLVESKEAMTASFAKIPFEILEKISLRITNEIPEVTRVVYDITHKPPATIEWE